MKNNEFHKGWTPGHEGAKEKETLSESLPKTSPASLEKALTEVCHRLNKPRCFKSYDFLEYCKKCRHSHEAALETLLLVERGLGEDAFKGKDVWSFAVSFIKALRKDGSKKSRDEGDKRDETKNNVPSANAGLTRDRDNRDDRDDILPPKKIKFSNPIEVEEAF